MQYSRRNQLGEGETFIRAPKITRKLSANHVVLVVCLTSFEEVGAERKVSVEDPLTLLINKWRSGQKIACRPISLIYMQLDHDLLSQGSCHVRAPGHGRWSCGRSCLKRVRFGWELSRRKKRQRRHVMQPSMSSAAFRATTLTFHRDTFVRLESDRKVKPISKNL